MSVDVKELKQLAEPFPAASIRWRVGSTTGDKKKGMALAYLDARDVMNRLDAVLGQNNWQDSYTHDGVRSICQLSIRVGSEWIVKSDGAGETDIEGEKGGISDAFKRAAVKWGVGRYLYALPARWETIEPVGKKGHKFTKDAVARLKGGTSRENSKPSDPNPEEEPTKKRTDAERIEGARKELNDIALQRGIRPIELAHELDKMAKAEGMSVADAPLKTWVKWWRDSDMWMGAMQTRKAMAEAGEGQQT